MTQIEVAIEDADDDGLYVIRFHPVLVDTTTGAVDFDPFPEAPPTPPTDAERRAANGAP